VKPNTARSMAVVLALLGLGTGAIACGSAKLAGDQQTTASPTGFASPSASPDRTPPPGSNVAVNQAASYSFFYPATWFEAPGAPDPTSQELSNENVMSPLQLDATGIWLSVDVSTNPTGCVPPPSSIPSGVGSRQEVIDGESAVLYLPPPGQFSATPQAWTHVVHNQWCYAFLLQAGSIQARDLHLGDLDQVLSSFKFNR
jgi:hypothetical protein